MTLITARVRIDSQGRPFPGTPWEAAAAASILGFSHDAEAEGLTVFRSLPVERFSTITALWLRVDQPCTVRLAEQNTGGVKLGKGGVLVLVNCQIAARPLTNVRLAAEGNELVHVDGWVGGTA